MNDRILRVVFCCSLLGLGPAVPAWAHDPGLSYVELRLQAEQLSGHVTFSQVDVERLVRLDVNGDGKLTDQEIKIALPALKRLIGGAFEVRFSGESVACDVGEVSFDSSNAIHFFVSWPRKPGSSLRFRSAILAVLPFGHRQFVSARDEAGSLLGERILDSQGPGFDVDLTAAGRSRLLSAREFVLLGVRHILTGYDHILFLFGLLIVGGKFAEAAKIITAFTLAHSITLALATLDLVRVAPRITEPLIAASIVYVGLENILGADLRRRWLLTFGFGLIHGFGFSSVLRELGIGAHRGGIALPLFSFNLGVELGQAAIAAVVLPIIWRLQKAADFTSRYVPAGSMLVTLVGTYWLIQRTLFS